MRTNSLRPNNIINSSFIGLDMQAKLNSPNLADTVNAVVSVYPSYKYSNDSAIVFVASNVTLTNSCIYATVTYGNFTPRFQVDNTCKGTHTNFDINSTFVASYLTTLANSPYLSGVKYLEVDVTESGASEYVYLRNWPKATYDTFATYLKTGSDTSQVSLTGARLEEVENAGNAQTNCLSIPTMQVDDILFNFTAGGAAGLDITTTNAPNSGTITPSGSCYGDHVSPYDTYSTTNVPGSPAYGYQINGH